MTTTDAGYYRRPLPAPLVAFASDEGRSLFREALAEGYLEGWFALAEQFHTQADPSFCGLGSLVVALNALGVDPGRLWKGPWRWYSEELLDCCLPLDAVRSQGITLDQFACLARCNGTLTETRRAGDAPVDLFRAALREASSKPGGPVVVASYSRRALGQTGDGHYSPVAALHEGRDLALVLDVARFKYPPHWVPVTALWEAMRPHDPATGRARGWVTLRRRPAGAAVLFRLSNANLPWAEALRRLLGDVPCVLTEAAPHDAAGVARAFVAAMPAEATGVLETTAATLDELAPEHRAQAEALLDALRCTTLHAEVARAGGGASAELTTMLLLSLPARVFEGLPADGRAAIEALRSPEALRPTLRAEVAIVREQVEALADVYGASAEPPRCDRCA
jgi:glutathione gamma-glutamylcysteinyltransferase